jgi:recombination protein RecA
MAKQTPLPISPDLIKKYGKLAFVRASEIVYDPSTFVSISPVLDVLTGGIPGGSMVILSGDQKCGKTITALQIAANAQKMGRQIYYFSIEARLKPRDSEGIDGLDTEQMVVIRSYKDDDSGEVKIFTAEEFLSIAEDIMHNTPGAVLIFDSISMLATEKEIESDLEDAHRAPGPVLMSRFLKRMKDVIAVNDLIIVSILHLIANTSGYGKAKNRSGGRKILYAADIDLECKTFKFIKGSDGRPIGQEVEWMTHATATVGPGHTMTSVIRYGVGIDKIEEIITLAATFDGIHKGGAWFTLNFLEPHVDDWPEDPKKPGHPYKFQGKPAVRDYFTKNPEHFDIIHKQVVEIFGP